MKNTKLLNILALTSGLMANTGINSELKSFDKYFKKPESKQKNEKDFEALNKAEEKRLRKKHKRAKVKN